LEKKREKLRLKNIEVIELTLESPHAKMVNMGCVVVTILIFCAIGYLYVYKYTNQLGLFDNFKRSGIIMFDYYHASENGRWMTSLNHGNFWLDKSWDWLRVGVPYEAKWHAVLGSTTWYTALDEAKEVKRL